MGSTPRLRPARARHVAASVLASVATAGLLAPVGAHAASTPPSLQGWGYDYYDQLGYSIPCFCAMVPAAIPILTADAASQATIVRVAAGGSHNLGLASDQTVWGWGRNYEGELGDGTNAIAEAVAVQVHTDATHVLGSVTAVAGGLYHSLAVRSDGTVWAWGSNSNGQLGNNTTTNSSYAVEVRDSASTFLSGVTAIAAGGYHSVALKSDGTVWAWGSNAEGQLGNNTTLTGGIGGTDSSIAVQVKTSSSTNLTGATAVAAGRDFSLAIKNDSPTTVWSWGRDDNGQLGDDSTSNSPVAVQVKTGASTNLTGASAIAGGGEHALALVGGAVWTWGSDHYGQLGDDGTRTCTTSPPDSSVAVPVRTGSTTTLSGITAISGGGEHSLALRSDGTVWAWGSNGVGQLGQGVFGQVPLVDPTSTLPCVTTDSSVAELVPGVGLVSGIAAGGAHNVVVVQQSA